MGLLSKGASTLASKTTGLAIRKAAPIVEEVAEDVVEKTPLVAPKRALKAAKAAEPTPTPAQAVEAPEGELTLSNAEMFAKQQSVAKQTEEALPAPTGESWSPYSFPNKVFTDDQYFAAEMALENSFAMESLYTKLKGNKEKFANELQKQAQKMFGKKGESVPAPYDIQSKAKTVDEAIAEVEATKAQKPFADITGEEDVLPKTPPSKGVLRGKLGSAGQRAADNNAIMEEIRQYREQAFTSLIASPKAAKYDDPVLTVALGEFRHKYGYEFDPVVKKDNYKMFKLLDEKQSEYSRIKKKYADTPDITISHGGRPSKIDSIASSGFRRPSLSMKGAQQELSSGATSLTRDMVLNYEQFGQSPENILTRQVPYAEYVFTRVNMSPKEYADKDMDAMARTITGSPDTVRSLQLPRSGFGETESAMIESDKFKMARAGDRVKNDFKDFVKFKEKREQLIKQIANQSARFVTGKVDQYGDMIPPKEMTGADARKAYSLVKEYIDNMSRLDRFTNVKSGMGQQYQDMIGLDVVFQKDYFSIIEKKLAATGANQKADNMKEFIASLERIHRTSDSKVQDSLLKLADKFKHGGLVRRK